MELLSPVLNGIVLVLMGLITFLIKNGKAGLEAGVKTSAEEGVKTAIRNINWPIELRQELEKSRGVERQELRFKSYGQLWSRLRPLAIYSAEPIDRAHIGELSERLSDWYFSECGGMLMTPHARDFYFALQDLVLAVGDPSNGDWQGKRISENPQALKTRFEGILQEKNLTGALEAAKQLSNPDLSNWPDGVANLGKGWHSEVVTLAGTWSSLSEEDRFVVLQQVGSMLRTILANDVESRLR